MANDRDVYSIASQYLGEKATEIVGALTGRDPNNLQINQSSTRILKRGKISSVLSYHTHYFDVSDQSEGDKDVLIKYFGDPRNLGGRKYKDFAQGTIDTCNLFGGNGSFPRFYHSDTIDGQGTFLAMEHIGQGTLHEKLKTVENRDVRLVLQGVLPFLARFQINALQNLYNAVKKGEMDHTKFFSIFGKRKSAERIIDYIRGGLGCDKNSEIPDGVDKKIIENTVPIQEIHVPRRENFIVNHGDPITKNIVYINHGADSYGFIDAEPKIGSPCLDLGALLATPNLGLNPNDWETLGKMFQTMYKRESDDFPQLEQMREFLVNTFADTNKKYSVDFSNRNSPGNFNFYLFGNLFFRNARIHAKVKDLKRKSPKLYEEMLRDDQGLATTEEDTKKNMSWALGAIVRSPDGKFEVTRDDYIKNLENLYQVLGDQGLIYSWESFNQNNENNHSLFVGRHPVKEDNAQRASRRHSSHSQKKTPA